jgi:2-keto-4-pentenoate hydratase/2-oxohepta-3-ene-1,7-dioic acid hydratase in catechol pathway
MEEATFLARIDGDGVTILLRESDRPGADVLREALGQDIDFGGDGEQHSIADVQFASPVASPTNFLAVGLNYRDHALESNLPIPIAPLLFTKSPGTIIGPNNSISIDASLTKEVDYEVELGVVIGRRCSKLSEAEALDYVFGYTVVNDVSARDVQFGDGQWTRGKSLDTFGPTGPSIVTVAELGDASGLRLRCSVNGELLQDGTTDDLIFGVRSIVSYISQGITLQPGDLITTGTPAGVGFGRTPPVYLRPGDVVETAIEGIGSIVNRVIAAG